MSARGIPHCRSDIATYSWFSDDEIDALIDWFYARLNKVHNCPDVRKRAAWAFATIVETSEFRKLSFRDTQRRLWAYIKHPNGRH